MASDVFKDCVHSAIAILLKPEMKLNMHSAIAILLKPEMKLNNENLFRHENIHNPSVNFMISLTYNRDNHIVISFNYEFNFEI